MRCAAERFVCLAHLRRKFHLTAGGNIEFLLSPVEHGVAVTYAINNVELTHRRVALWVVSITLTCSSHSSTLVVYLWTAELSRHRISLGSLAKKLSGLRVTARGIAGLNHEFAYDTMEQQPVVQTFADILQEVVAMERCLIIKSYAYVSLVCLKQDFMTQRVLSHCRHAKKQCQNTK